MSKENNSKIEIMQYNTARSIPIMHSCLESAFQAKTDFLLIQEPWIAEDNKGTISHPAFESILPQKQDIRPRVIIYIRKASIYKYCARPDIISDSDIIILNISGPGVKDFQLINIYNERSLSPNNEEWTLNRSLNSIQPEGNTIICGDFNAHHN